MTSKEVTYTVAMNVSTSWDTLKMTDNYKEVVGELIFQRLFELEPKTRSIFQMGDVGNKDLKSHPNFTKHAHVIVDMIDYAVDCLGPDVDSLAEHLNDLGRRHIGYGVQASHVPIMGEASVFALEKVLGSQFTASDRKDWTTIFQFMTGNMIKGMMKR
jgi:hemoglobin-like flavoprotein